MSRWGSDWDALVGELEQQGCELYGFEDNGEPHSQRPDRLSKRWPMHVDLHAQVGCTLQGVDGQASWEAF